MTFLGRNDKEMRLWGRWIRLVITCIGLIFYSVQTNGQPGESFKTTWGIRQGDPLSLYLYLLCLEGLSALLEHAKKSGNIEGIKMAQGSPHLTLLFFADEV